MNLFFRLLFWISNATLLVVLGIGFLPSIGFALARDSIGGQVPIDLILPFIGLVGVPFTATIAGIKQQQTKLPSLSLFELFYALEAPILAACVIRLFMLRDLTPASGFLLVSGLLGFFGSCYWFWQQRQADSIDRQRGDLVTLVGLSLFLIVSLYLSTIVLFFVLPVGVWFIAHAYVIFISIIVFPLFACGFALTSLPFGMVFVAQKLWWQNLQQSIDRYGKSTVQALIGGLAIGWVVVLIAMSHQPQVRAFALVTKQPLDRSANLQQSAQIQKGLLNAYLADYRYLRYQDDETVLNAYKWLQLPQSMAQGIQSTYNFVTDPFTYQGSRSDREDAAKLYAQFFDTPILRGEKDRIRHAVESNFNRSEVNAGLLSVDAKRVFLAQQQLKISPHGDWADVELHETYSGQTLEREEIFYYFSLPESATVTGVWLGETSNRSLRYPFQVSTRGAAQQVYKEQIQQRVDPALLEQVGPQNYRLRVYPILPQGKPMHMWMTYKVMKQDGSWQLPQLNERRNVYWNRQTKRTVDGKLIAVGDKWLPDSIAADKSAPEVHQLTLPNGNQIIAKPFDPQGYSLPQNKRLAIVLDGSYSMNAHRPELAKTIDWLQAKILPHNQLDLYLTTSPAGKPQSVPMAGFKPDTAIFYGSIEPQQMLAQFETLRQAAANAKYDAIVMITDRGSYELTAEQAQIKSMPAPLWMVHLGGLPSAYDDATLAAIQSSGGSISTDVKTVMQRIATLPSLGQSTSLLSVVDNYAWFLSQTADPTVKQSDQGFEPIAARQWVTQVSQSLKPTQLKELDAVHVLAKRYNLVTPYSSMIVLVNDQQKEDLKKAEQGKDRFQREGEDKPLPALTQVSATPEPAEWLLLAIAILMLGMVYQRNTTKSSI
jgi:putative PEP-CTERM system integral membrane protein